MIQSVWLTCGQSKTDPSVIATRFFSHRHIDMSSADMTVYKNVLSV